MKFVYSVIVCYFVITFNISAQSPGLVIQTGVSTAYAKDGNITFKNQAHYGYFIGADARILEGSMYFIIGGQYHATSLGSTSDPSFFTNNDWKIFMGRLGLGFDIIKLSDNLALRSKLLGSINFNIESPENALNKQGYDTLNDSFLGATTGVGVTIGFIDIDLDFQYGLINAYTKQPKSTFDFWTLGVGVHF
jgi:hypothetical protein